MEQNTVNAKKEDGQFFQLSEFQQYARHTKQGGYSLIGFGLAALLAVGVIYGSIQYYNDNTGRVAESQAQTNLAALRAGIGQKIGRLGNFGALDTNGSQLLIDMEIVPGSLVQGSQVRNEYNGFYTFGSSDGGVSTAPDDAYATITTDELPMAICMDLAVQTGWQQVLVNSTEVDGTQTGAQTACNDEGNELTFVFRR